jgi:hypothetical protein
MPTLSTQRHRLAVLLLLALAGCADSTAPVDALPRKALSGSVSLDGQPLAQGKIQFDPVGAGAGNTTLATGEIKDGKFAIDRASGPVPGKYKVSISSVPPIKIGPGEEPGARPKMDPEKVPAKYNTRTTLTEEITDGSAPLNYDLKSN